MVLNEFRAGHTEIGVMICKVVYIGVLEGRTRSELERSN
jgi:hypothetical protein